MKGKDGQVMTDEESVLRIWKEYYQGLINEENERHIETEIERGGRDGRMTGRE